MGEFFLGFVCRENEMTLPRRGENCSAHFYPHLIRMVIVSRASPNNLAPGVTTTVQIRPLCDTKAHKNKNAFRFAIFYIGNALKVGQTV